MCVNIEMTLEINSSRFIKKEKCTFSVFTFFAGPPPLLAFASSPFVFRFPFVDLEVVGVPRADPEEVAFKGLLSTGSSFGASFGLGASTGEKPSSSVWKNQTQQPSLKGKTNIQIKLEK